MISFDLENITKGIGVVTASLALIGGGYTLWDKIESKDILTWAPEYFTISDAQKMVLLMLSLQEKNTEMTVKLLDLDLKSKTVNIWFTLHPLVLQSSQAPLVTR